MSKRNEFEEMILAIHNALSCDLIYTHDRVNKNTNKTLESNSFLYALIERLNDKGLILIEELECMGGL